MIRDNDGRGVFLEDVASVSTLQIDRSRIERNGQQGIYVQPTSKPTVRDTTLADNGMHGVEIEAHTGQTITVEIVKTLICGNSTASSSRVRAAVLPSRQSPVSLRTIKDRESMSTRSRRKRG